MTDIPSDLNAGSVIELIESGAYPRDTVVTIARGFLPLPQEELVAVLAYLTSHADAEIAEASRASLAELPKQIVLAFARSEEGNPEYLTRLMLSSTDQVIVEALIRNKAVPDAAVAELSRRAEPSIQDVIVINQARILRTPAIIDALLENPVLSIDVRRRALETREEFFEKKARLLQTELPPDLPVEPDLADAPNDVIADLLEKSEDPEFQQTSISTGELNSEDQKDEKKVAEWVRILNMTVAQKVIIAFRGDKSVRMLLVRERNKLVASSVMRNPRMTDQEAETIAGMRNVDEEVLRLLSLKRDWMAKYPIILNLCKNPKAPIGVVLPLINRLALRDLKSLKDDRGVSETVRTSAKRMFIQRTQK